MYVSFNTLKLWDGVFDTILSYSQIAVVANADVKTNLLSCEKAILQSRLFDIQRGCHLKSFLMVF